MWCYSQCLSDWYCQKNSLKIIKETCHLGREFKNKEEYKEDDENHQLVGWMNLGSSVPLAGREISTEIGEVSCLGLGWGCGCSSVDMKIFQHFTN